jgi:heme O synthase-like polyprenyltransferase
VLIVSLIPAVLTLSISPLYLLLTTLLGLGQIGCSVSFSRQRSDSSARRLLRASLFYLPIQLVLITLLNLAVI